MITCLICDNPTTVLGKVNFNKTCVDTKIKRVFPKSKLRVEYVECDHCGLIFSPEMCSWPKEKFTELIYNKDYIKTDPEYLKIRPNDNANLFHQMLRDIPLAHLDYGGGEGQMSRVLRLNGWNSTSWDPFTSENTPTKKFDLITAIEVFEHHPSPVELLLDIVSYLGSNSAIMFTTCLHDGVGNPLEWWYISPRNGHIVIYTRKSLALLFKIAKFNLFKMDANNMYVAYKNKPTWLNA